ncbi:MAG: KRRI-Interacting protein 1, partial [Marteilia pararefringens]
ESEDSQTTQNSGQILSDSAAEIEERSSNDQIPILKEESAKIFLEQIRSIRSSEQTEQILDPSNFKSDFEYLEVEKQETESDESTSQSFCSSFEDNIDDSHKDSENNHKSKLTNPTLFSQFLNIEDSINLEATKELFRQALSFNDQNQLDSDHIFDIRKSVELTKKAYRVKLSDSNNISSSAAPKSRHGELNIEKIIGGNSTGLQDEDKFLLDYIVNARYVGKLDLKDVSDQDQPVQKYNDPSDSYRQNLPKILKESDDSSKKSKKKLKKEINHKQLEKTRLREINDINRKILDINLSSGIIDDFQYQSLINDSKFMNSKTISADHTNLVSIDFNDEINSDIEDYILKKIEDCKSTQDLNTNIIDQPNTYEEDSLPVEVNEELVRKMRRKQEKLAKKASKLAKKGKKQAEGSVPTERLPDSSPKDNSLNSKLKKLREIEESQVKNTQKCLFRYNRVPKANFNLTDFEILNADDEELNKWCKISKVVDYVDERTFAKRTAHFSRKGEKSFKKRNILKSIYGESKLNLESPKNQDSSQEPAKDNSVKQFSKNRLKAYGL